MTQTLGLVSLVVRDYDEALAFYVGKLGFRLVEDSCVPEQDEAPYGTVAVFKDLYGTLWDLVQPAGGVARPEKAAADDNTAES